MSGTLRIGTESKIDIHRGIEEESMRKALLVVLAMLCTLVLNGCATIFSTSEYPVTIRSLPTQLTVEVSRSDGHVVHKATTPVTITLTTKKDKKNKHFEGEDYTIKLIRDGDVVGETELKSRLDKWYLANMIHGGFIGMLIVDPYTGCMWALNEDVLVTENLSTSAGEASSLQIKTLDEVSEEKRALLVQVTN